MVLGSQPAHVTCPGSAVIYPLFLHPGALGTTSELAAPASSALAGPRRCFTGVNVFLGLDLFQTRLSGLPGGWRGCSGGEARGPSSVPFLILYSSVLQVHLDCSFRKPVIRLTVGVRFHNYKCAFQPLGSHGEF